MILTRTTDTLLAFDDIKILLQYLYMDESNRITFNNGLTDLKLRMTEDLRIKSQNMSFPDLPEMDFTQEMTPANILGIIETLMDMPKEELTKENGYTNPVKGVKNRWDEIVLLTRTNMSLNGAMKYRNRTSSTDI